MTAIVITWVCPRGHSRQTIDSTNKGPGAPACHVCQSAMQPVSGGGEFPRPAGTDADYYTESCLLPGMAKALERLDPDLQQEPEA